MVKKRRDDLFLKIILVGFIAIIAIVFIPTQYMVMSPGIAEELSTIITVEDGYQNFNKGAFLLTAVTSKRATALDFLFVKLRNPKGYVIEPMEEHLPEGMNMAEYYDLMLISMENSKNIAKTIAFEKAGYDVEVKNRGVFINEILDHGSAKGKLEKGDRIIAIDDKEVEEDQDAIDFIREHEIGEELKVTVERDGETQEYNMETIQLNEDEETASIGVMIYTDLFFDFPKEVVFHTENIGGASAGGMFTLEIYNQLTSEDITNGKKIAGTGAINLDGEIGEIDGVEQKVITAERNNALVFFAPEDNYEAAKETASTIEVVKIETIDDAISYLQELKE